MGFFRWGFFGFFLGGFFIANPVARLEAAEAGRTDYTVVRIPRAREVRQSYLSAVASFLWAFLACLRPVTQHQVPGNPDEDLHSFLPPRSGSGSISQRNGSGSGSFLFLIKMLSGLK